MTGRATPAARTTDRRRETTEAVLGDLMGRVRLDKLRCFAALAVGSWSAVHMHWWMANAPRAAAPNGAERPNEWAAARAFLEQADRRCCIDIKVKADHWGLVAISHRSERSFWR